MMTDLVETLKVSDDPKTWGEGLWLIEPLGYDGIAMNFKGYECCFVRHRLFGNWNGYIGISNQDYDFIVNHDLELYGGITYESQGSSESTYPSSKIQSNDKIIGFDCGHMMDIMPRIEAVNRHAFKDSKFDLSRDKFATYKTLSFCKKEVRRFINELIKLKEAHESKKDN